MVKDHGLLEVLRRFGIERLDKKTQHRIAAEVQHLTNSGTPFVYSRAAVDRRTRLSKLRRLADDPACTAGERQAALAAIERLTP